MRKKIILLFIMVGILLMNELVNAYLVRLERNSDAVGKNQIKIDSILGELQYLQYTFKMERFLDQNKNDIGEYASTAHLVNMFNTRRKTGTLMTYVNKHDVAMIHGFYLKVYLPDDYSEQEKHFIIYIWPIVCGKTGFGCICLDNMMPKRTVIKFSGLDNPPKVHSAYVNDPKKFEFGMGEINSYWCPYNK